MPTFPHFPLSSMSLPRRRSSYAMVHKKITYYNMFTSKRCAKLAVESAEAQNVARIGLAQPPTSPESGVEVDPAIRFITAGFEVADAVAGGGDNIRLLSMEEAEEQFCLTQAEEAEDLAREAQFEAKRVGAAAFAELIPDHIFVMEKRAILKSE